VFSANVALGRPTVQASTYQTLLASLAVDNDLGTASCTISHEEPWWSVDLGTQMDVASVCVTNDAHDVYGRFPIMIILIYIYSDRLLPYKLYKLQWLQGNDLFL